MMGRAIIGVIALGAVTGFLIPAAKPPVSTPAPPAKLRATAQQAASPAPSAPRKTYIDRAPNGHFYVDAQVNGQWVHFVVDTGATAVVLTMADAQRAGVPFDRNQFTVIARGASGDVRGQIVKLQRVAVDRQEAWDVEAAVVDEGLDVSLLGQSWLSQIDSVQISGNQMILG